MAHGIRASHGTFSEKDLLEQRALLELKDPHICESNPFQVWVTISVCSQQIPPVPQMLLGFAFAHAP
jgi:hypothetical protein